VQFVVPGIGHLHLLRPRFLATKLATYAHNASSRVLTRARKPLWQSDLRQLCRC
jgi:hypothetical protein